MVAGNSVGDESVGIPWLVTAGFVRIRTNPRLFTDGATIDQILDRVHEWYDSPVVSPLHPGNRHLEVMDRLLRKLGRGGDLVSDAHLAALAIEHHGKIHSADKDFALFPEVNAVNPLAET